MPGVVDLEYSVSRGLTQLKESSRTGLYQAGRGPRVPLVGCFTKTNLGGADYHSEPFSRPLSPMTTHWPALYEDEQLMILEIPFN